MHHADQGSQYASLALGRRLRKAGLTGSMGSRGDGADYAAAESFFATLECDWLARRRFRSQAAARMACFSYIEGLYNPLRRHSPLGYRSPVVHEQETRPEPSTEPLPSQAP